MADKDDKRGLKRPLFLGIAALLPLVITILVIWVVFEWIGDKVGVPILNWAEEIFNPNPVTAPWKDTYRFLYGTLRPVISFSIFVFATVGAGFFFSTYIGRRVYRFFEQIFVNAPIVKSVYPLLKQVIDFFVRPPSEEMRKVVVVPYPRRGIYQLGLVTGEALDIVKNRFGGERTVSVLLPTSPNPITGYLVMIPADEVIPVKMSVEDAVKMIITGGIAVPEAEQIETPSEFAEASA